MQPGELVGQTLGHYQIKRQIGHGGMSAVFLAEDILLGREVALKVFWPRPGETQDFLRRFSREARVLAQLDHPHILPVYDYGEQGERAYLVTPYMAGGTLKELLRKRKVLPPSEAVELISQVLPALQYAHERNLIHRDIKPGNLLFKADGSLVLADFGLVKVVQGKDAPLHTLSETGKSIAGTPEYMAPEQIEGRAVAASDIYAMGIVLYEMVTGLRPFTGDSLFSTLMKHVNEMPRPPRELNPYISPQLEATILRALAREPQNRFARPGDFLQALQQAGNPSSHPGIAGTRNNPVSHPGMDGPTSPMPSVLSEYGPALTPGWTQTPTLANSGGAASSQDPGFNRQGPTRQHMPLPAQPPVNLAQQGPVIPPVPATPLPPVQAWGRTQTVPPSQTPAPRSRRTRAPIVALTLLVVLIAGIAASLFLTPLGTKLFGQHPSVTPTSAIAEATSPGRGGHSPTPGGSQPVPATTTSCPVASQARPAVLAPLALGHDPTLVYLVNESNAGGDPTFGTVKLYDTVNGAKTELAKAEKTRVTEAQISNDGAWVLFTTQAAGQSELRLVRLDGQGLQTLVCAPSNRIIRDSQWSFDQKYVIFDEFPHDGGAPTVYLLNILTGALQVEVVAPTSGIALIPRTWLDYHRILMIGIVPDSDAPPQNIYVLDISNGANQTLASAHQVFTSTQPCWGFDSSYDGRSLFIAQCQPAQPAGSSTLIQQPLDGGTASTVLNSSTLAFDTVRVIDTRDINLLALASDTSLGAASGDPAHDGLYLVKSDNSAPPQRLTSTPAGQTSELNSYSQYYWANVSRDQSLYALTTITSNNVYSIAYGSISGGASTTIASIGEGTTLAFAGWTTS